MPYLLNLIYLVVLLLASPWLVYKAITTGKYRVGMLRKFLGLAPFRTSGKPCVWFHAVSVGEVLLLKQVIARFRQAWPHWECVLSTTTNTGFDVARKTYPDLTVFYFPLDFTWAVERALGRIRPALVVLAELELWPNFILAARRKGIRVAVVNGRLSPKSHRGYRRIRWLMGSLLRQVDLFAMQSEDYATRIRDLGAPAERVHVTGSVKYDGVTTDRENAKTQELGRIMGIDVTSPRLTPRAGAGDGELVWVVGSTQAPEEEIALGIYRRAVERFPNLRLILVPRHKERFDEVADLLTKSGLPFVRRSQLTPSPPHPFTPSSPHPIILIDTLGELGAVWGLADVAFVGGSLTQRGGQNMIEPAAYGAAVTFGPHIWNFQETVDRLLEHNAAIQIRDAEELERVTLDLLADVEKRRRLGEAAQRFVLSQQGATGRTIALLENLISDQTVHHKDTEDTERKRIAAA